MNSKFFKLAFLFVLILALGWITPAKLMAAVNVDLVAEQIQKRVEPARPARVAGETLHAVSLLKIFYEPRNYRPAWQSQKQIRSMINAIHQSDRDGLNPLHYHLNQIDSLIKKRRGSNDPVILAEIDLLLSDAFFTLASHYSTGLFNPYNRRVVWFNPQAEEKDFPTLLDRALKSNRIGEALLSLAPSQPGYAKLREALEIYRKKAHKEKWPLVSKGPKLEPGADGERVAAVKKRLHVAGYLKNFSSSTSTLFDDEMEEALKVFQKQHGLAVDGKVGPATVAALNVSPEKRVCQIRGNLDRLRAYYRKFNDRYLMVNIPDFRLDVIEKEKSILGMPVIVGRRDRKSPLLIDQMEFVVLSPYWHVPRSIAVKDKLPIIKKDPTYLSRHGMKMYQNNGNGLEEVSPETVDWELVDSQNFNYKITQKPGAGNALGRVKFMFPNRYSVYIHDTPSKSLFKRAVRTFSSGCIRIEQPTDLAEYVLSDNADWNRKKIIAAMNRGVRRDVKLSEPLPVHIVYITAWVDEEGVPQFRNDIYNYDSSFKKMLCTKEKNKRYSSLKN